MFTQMQITKHNSAMEWMLTQLGQQDTIGSSNNASIAECFQKFSENLGTCK